MPPPTILISGLGFMGGSLAAALSRLGWTVLLHHRRAEVSARAAQLGYGQQVDDLAVAMAAAELAVVCTTVEAIPSTVRHLAAHPSAAVITDIGSVKGSICTSLADLCVAGRFVGSHPMAGSHLQGLEQAQHSLYRGCTTAITPVAGTPDAAVGRIERLWQALGSRTLRFDPYAHDLAVAQASHVPHVLAAVAAAGLDQASAVLAASGFRDTTRVAASSPQVWSEILLHNRRALLAEVSAAHERLTALASALSAGDLTAIATWLAAGCEGRSRFERAQQESALQKSGPETGDDPG